MARYAMAIDINKCNGCYNCFLACKDEYSGNDYPPFSLALPAASKPWLVVREIERGTCPKVKVDYIPIPCQQCDTPACVEKSPQGTVYKRADGVVIIDPEKALGRREIVNSCPHRLITWNEEKNIAQKCSFCVHLLEKGWKAPRCVEACPSGALVFGDLDDAQSEVALLHSKNTAQSLSADFDLNPNVAYFGLPRKMITGEVILSDKQNECARDVVVTLQDGTDALTTTTDYLGDFEFDGLEGNHPYTLKIVHEGYQSVEMVVKTARDVNLGEIVLEPK